MSKILILGGCLFVAILLGAFVWQKSVQTSKENDAEDHLAVAAVIESAEADGVAAAELLAQYVETGDPSLLPMMQERTDAGVQQLTTAISQAGGDPNGFVQAGSEFVQAAGQVIALRQAGDAQAAANALALLGEDFNAFIAAQDQFSAGERELATEASASADDAGTTALGLAIVAGMIWIAVVAGTIVAVSRRLVRGRTADVQPA